jgi:hypothetical protein
MLASSTIFAGALTKHLPRGANATRLLDAPQPSDRNLQLVRNRMRVSD